MYLSERLNRNVSVMARNIKLCKIDTSPTYPFRYHCYFGHRIAYERVQDALLPSFASHGSISSISLFHTIKKTFGQHAKISRSLFETGFSGFLSDYSCVVLRTVYHGGIDYHLPHHYRLPVFLPFHRWLGCLKNKHSERIKTRRYSYSKTPAFPNEEAFFI